MAVQEYINRFEEVHRKTKAFKDRIDEINKRDAELREVRLAEETRRMIEKGK